MAAEVDGKLADYNDSVGQCVTEHEQHLTTLERDATAELDAMAHQAERSLIALTTDALAALDARKAEMLATIDRAALAATTHIEHMVTAIRAQATTQVEDQCQQLATAGHQAREIFADAGDAEQVAELAAEARGQLDQVGAEIGQAILGMHATTQRELSGEGEAAATSMAEFAARNTSQAETASAAIADKLTAVATGAVTSFEERGGKAGAALADGGQIFTQQLTQSHQEFTGRLGGLVALATQTIGDKIDAGLAYQDQWVDKAQTEARSTVQQIGDRYDALKSQADARNSSGAQRSWLSDAWDAVTGWIDSVRQWFLRTFGDFWGGLLFGILSALVVVVIVVVDVVATTRRHLTAIRPPAA